MQILQQMYVHQEQLRLPVQVLSVHVVLTMDALQGRLVCVIPELHLIRVDVMLGQVARVYV